MPTATMPDFVNPLLSKLHDTQYSLPACKAAICEANKELLQHYRDGALAPELLELQSALTDQVLAGLWNHTLPASENPPLCLVAVGGYGRAELHPNSDIDILILTAREYHAADTAISDFVTAMWDIGMDVGHSVRDIDQCINEAREDLSTITNLLEGRFLVGDATLYQEFSQALANSGIWPERAFFAAKQEELRERQKKYRDAAYRLEPNLKESPGGLRDIHCIEWLLLRRHGNDDLQALISDGYLTAEELHELQTGRNHLWRIRFVLHHIAGRKEDRLLFDHQRTLAEEFGYPVIDGNASVEQFMQRYYRVVTELERINEMVLQLIEKDLFPEVTGAPVATGNKRFVVRNRYVEVAQPDVFERYPPAMLELFYVFAEAPDVRGIAAETLRLLRSHLDNIDSRFRKDMIVRDLFMQVISQNEKVTRKLRLMNRYGVLARYLPAFEKIVGRMQYDLFHIYTVDEHTLMVIRNLRRFALPQHREEFPHCSEVMQQVKKPQMLYVTALFHDIAKGRDGDHSELGAVDAEEFCRSHGLLSADTRIIVWTVKHHLVMSMTAQHKDISDPAVVQTFARLVGTVNYLNFLYLLTVADIRGTNPEMWNSWKANLLRQLYEGTYKALLRGLDNPQDKVEIIAEKKSRVIARLGNNGIAESTIKKIWSNWAENYFLRYSTDEIQWHIQNIARHRGSESLITIRQQTQRGSTEVFIHAKDEVNLFGRIVSVLARLQLDVVSAKILTSPEGMTLNTFWVLDLDGSTITDESRLQAISSGLRKTLQHPDTGAPSVSSVVSSSRRLRNFKLQPTIEFDNEFAENYTCLLITAIDTPGLLGAISRTLSDYGIKIAAANIATFGEKAEDVFYVLDNNDNKLPDPDIAETLQQALIAILAEEP